MIVQILLLRHICYRQQLDFQYSKPNVDVSGGNVPWMVEVQEVIKYIVDLMIPMMIVVIQCNYE